MEFRVNSRRLPVALDAWLHASVLARSVAQLFTDIASFPSYGLLLVLDVAHGLGWIGIVTGSLGVVSVIWGHDRMRVFTAALAAAYCAMFVVSFSIGGNWSAAAYVFCFVAGYAFSVERLARGAWR